MEGVPRLPMLVVELKQNAVDFSSLDWAGMPSAEDYYDSIQQQTTEALKQHIREEYGDDPEKYNDAINRLLEVQLAAYKAIPSPDFEGCTTVKKYFGQLHYMQSRFPFKGENGLSVLFAWQDAFTGYLTERNAFEFEQTAILFCIGAIHSFLGAADTRVSEEAIRISCVHFQCAAGIFKYLSENFDTTLSPDISQFMLKLYINLSLAQGQECFLEKSMQDNRRSSIVAKICQQVVEYYKQCLRSMENKESNTALGSSTHKAWKRMINFKVQYYSAITKYFMGCSALDQDKYGQSVSYFGASVAHLNELTKLAKSFPKEIRGKVDSALKFTADVFNGKYNSGVKDNNYVYHDKVPDPATLPEAVGTSLVKPLPFEPANETITGSDFFAKLVPMEAHLAASTYSEEKAKLLRTVVANVDEKNAVIDQYKSSIELDPKKLINPNENMKLNLELIEKCALLNTDQAPISDLKDQMNVLNDVYSELDSVLNDILVAVEKEESEDLKLKETAEKEAFSVQDDLGGIRRELSVYTELHQKAGRMNEDLQTACRIHIQNMKVVATGISGVQEDLKLKEMSQLISEEDKNDIELIRKLCNKVVEMEQQRKHLLDQLRQQMDSDDVTSALVTKHGVDQDDLFKEELKKYDSLIGTINQNLAAQDNILDAVTEANARYTKIRKAVDTERERIEQRSKNLVLSCTIASDVSSRCNDGRKFFGEILSKAKDLYARVKEFQDENEEKRDGIYKKIEEKKKPPPRPSAPKPNLKPASGIKPITTNVSSGAKPGMILSPEVLAKMMAEDDDELLNDPEFLQFLQNQGDMQQLASIPTVNPVSSPPFQPSNVMASSLPGTNIQPTVSMPQSPQQPTPRRDGLPSGPGNHSYNPASMPVEEPSMRPMHGYQANMQNRGLNTSYRSFDVPQPIPREPLSPPVALQPNANMLPSVQAHGIQPVVSVSHSQMHPHQVQRLPSQENVVPSQFQQNQIPQQQNIPFHPASTPQPATGNYQAQVRLQQSSVAALHQTQMQPNLSVANSLSQPSNHAIHHISPAVQSFQSGLRNDRLPTPPSATAHPHHYQRPPHHQLPQNTSAYGQPSLSNTPQQSEQYTHLPSQNYRQPSYRQAPIPSQDSMNPNLGNTWAMPPQGHGPTSQQVQQVPQQDVRYSTPALPPRTPQQQIHPYSHPHSLPANSGVATSATHQQSQMNQSQGFPQQSHFHPQVQHQSMHQTPRSAHPQYIEPPIHSQAPPPIQVSQVAIVYSAPSASQQSNAQSHTYAVRPNNAGLRQNVPVQYSVSKSGHANQPQYQALPSSHNQAFPVSYVSNTGPIQPLNQYPASSIPGDASQPVQNRFPPTQSVPRPVRLPYLSGNRNQMTVPRQPMMQPNAEYYGSGEPMQGNISALGPGLQESRRVTSMPNRFPTPSQQNSHAINQRNAVEQSYQTQPMASQIPTHPQPMNMSNQHIIRPPVPSSYNQPLPQAETRDSMAGQRSPYHQPRHGTVMNQPGPTTQPVASQHGTMLQLANDSQLAPPHMPTSNTSMTTPGYRAAPPQNMTRQQPPDTNFERQAQTSVPQRFAAPQAPEESYTFRSQPHVGNLTSTPSNENSPKHVPKPRNSDTIGQPLGILKPTPIRSSVSTPAAAVQPSSDLAGIVLTPRSNLSSSADELLLSGPEQTSIPAKNSSQGMLIPTKVDEVDDKMVVRPIEGLPYMDDADLMQFKIQVSQFRAKVANLLIKPNNTGLCELDKEWKKLSESQEIYSRKHSTAVARCSSYKNRYQDIVPFDQSRVILNAAKDDYINASVIDGISPYCPRFIATQSPMPNTASDFWLMVYEQQVNIIVMLVNSKDVPKKCPMYWPSDRTVPQQHGPLTVSFTTSKTHGDLYVERTFTIKHRSQSLAMSVTQLQYIAWPEHRLPSSASDILSFVRVVQAYHSSQRNLQWPVLVQCESGVGRTGVFCAFVAGINEINAGMGIVDVVDVLTRMRHKRKYMVQEKAQFKFVYDVILYHAIDVLKQRNVTLMDEPKPTPLPTQASSNPIVSNPGSSGFDIFSDHSALSSIQATVERMTIKPGHGPENENMTFEGTGTNVYSTIRDTDHDVIPDASVQPFTDSSDACLNFVEMSDLVQDTITPAPAQNQSISPPSVQPNSPKPPDVVESCNNSPSNTNSAQPDAESLDNSTMSASLIDSMTPESFTLNLEESGKKKQRISKADFFKAGAGLSSENDASDPFSGLDPLWGLRK